ncbi:MAG: hypothetical protein KC609_18455 [Myxococcales bacterium]|nr:hypothetical protein [Myxococcales bacterium]
MSRDVTALTALLLAWHAAHSSNAAAGDAPPPTLHDARSQRVWQQLQTQFAQRGAQFSAESLRRQIPALASEHELQESPIDASWIAHELSSLETWERRIVRSLFPVSLDQADDASAPLRLTSELRLFLRHTLFGSWLPDPLARASTASVRELDRLGPSRCSQAMQRLGQLVMALISTRGSVGGQASPGEAEQVRRWVARQIESATDHDEPLPDLYQHLGVAALSLLLIAEPANVCVRLGLRLARGYGLRLHGLVEAGRARGESVEPAVMARVSGLLDQALSAERSPR